MTPNIPQTSGALPERAVFVRPYAQADRDFVLGLASRFGDTRAPWRTHDEVTRGTQRQLGRAMDVLREMDALLVAVDGTGTRLGFAYVVTEDDFFTGEPHGHLSEIAVERDGNGAGSALIAASEAWSRERGHRYLSLNVNDANERGRAFYGRRGYVPEYRHLVKLL